MKQCAVFLAVLTLFALPVMAQADTFILLDTPNDAISAFDDPYALVTIHLTDATHATITFNSQIVNALTPDGVDYLMGAEGAVAVNVNATTWVLSNIQGSNSHAGFTPGAYSDGGSGNEDGHGSYNQRIDSFDGYTHSADLISFDLQNTSGTWLSSATVLTNNNSDFLAAAHIFVTDSPADPAVDALATGFAAGSIALETSPFDITPVPEPGTLLMFGSGLIGMGAAVKRKYFG
jgi:PEP-CTERM motif